MLKLRGTSTPVAALALPPPRLADGVDLIGEYRDSGFREAPYIARIPSGKIVQLPRLLYLVAESIDGDRDAEAIAERVTKGLGVRVTADQIQYLLAHKLRPLGLLAEAEGEPLDPGGGVPLAFTVRRAFVPASVVRPLAALLRPLFRPTLVGAALAWLAVLDFWLYADRRLDGAVVDVVRRPTLMLVVFGLVLASTVFHELGHAAACRFGGGRPGAIGAGLYYVWPAFFTDVTDAYRLDRRGRLRTDLGGIYFNILFILGVAAVYFRTHEEALLVFIALQHLQILNQFVPWVRLDGYYVLTDLTGVPDVLTRIKPVLRSLIPDREPEPRVEELKPWVRIVLSVYVVTLIPVLAFTIVLLLVHAPRFFLVAASSLHSQVVALNASLERQDAGGALVAAAQFAILVVPTLGMTLTVVRITRAIVGRVIRGRRLRLMLVFAGAGVLATAGFAAAPPVYHPIPHRTESRDRDTQVPRTPATTSRVDTGTTANAPTRESTTRPSTETLSTSPSVTTETETGTGTGTDETMLTVEETTDVPDPTTTLTVPTGAETIPATTSPTTTETTATP